MGRKGGNPDISKHGVKFGDGQDSTKGGRKKKIYTILKEKGYCNDDISTAFGEMAFYTFAELEKVYEDEKMPVITRIIAHQFYQSLADGDWKKIKEIMDHVIGRPSINKEKPSSGGENEKDNMGKISFRLGYKPLSISK